ncbi:D,D-dipeptide ABC transporter permease [Escherichia coli]|nr:D,D-dipeptide ABC transporter permease [Escherichia coli]
MMLSEETSAVRPQKQTRFNGAKLVWMLKGSPLTVTGAVIIVLMLLMMIFSPWLATHDPNAIDLTARLLPPSAAHWFGTDEVGRDLFSRVLVGSQQSILAGLVVVAIAGMIGSLLGCLSGVLGGRADAIIMRIMDIMLSIPSLVLTMALAAALGPSLFNAMLAIAIVRIPFYVRLARGQALVVRQYTYVQAAKTFGASRWHLINWHILRNSLPPLIVQASLDIGSAILMAATLGFIGLGAQQPSAEWGAMVANGRNYVLDQWWYCAFPGAAILLTAVGFNLFGDGIRDLLDPKIVELGDAQQVLTAPAHPYTRLLLDSLPAIDKPLEEEWALRKTDLPGNRTLPQGCFFYERCPLATHGCEVRQSLTIREDGREIRCWRAL